MLCLLTLVDVEAVSPKTLTPWREELLWRLYVDTYNHLTLEYADERIEHQESGCARSIAGRPRRRDGGRDHAVRRGAAAPLSAALPARRDLPPRAARHATSRPDDVHADLERKGSLWS